MRNNQTRPKHKSFTVQIAWLEGVIAECEFAGDHNPTQLEWAEAYRRLAYRHTAVLNEDNIKSIKDSLVRDLLALEE